MRKLAVTMILAVAVSVVVASADVFAWTLPGKSGPTSAQVLTLQQEVAELKAKLAQMEQRVQALTGTQQATSNLEVPALSPGPLGGLTPTRMLTPNPQNYWLRLRQPQTGSTWSFASEPSTGTLRFGSDTAPGYAQLRISANGGMTTGPLVLEKTGVAGPSRGYPSSDLALRASCWDMAENAPVDLTASLRMTPISGDSRGPGYALNVLDPYGNTSIQLLNPPGSATKELYFWNQVGPMLFNLLNETPGEQVFIRYWAGDLVGGDGQWLVGLGGGGPYDAVPGSFCILRDWYWTAMKVEENDGRILIGRLLSHPPANPPAAARLHVRGLVDEPQALVQANSTQSVDVFQVQDSAGTDYLSVTNTGNTAIGAASQPRSIVLYDIADGSTHYLRVNNNTLELVSP